MTLTIGKPTEQNALIIEAWAQGFMTGSLIIMAAITVANMRRKVLLHKLILIELIFGMFQGTFIFPKPPYYGYYLSVGGIFLNASWVMHNVIAWMKNKPFLTRRVSMIYITTVALSVPYWILEITANFLYFNPPYNQLFTRTRPYEALMRDPWWIFTVVSLLWNVKRRYEFSLVELIKVSPRFGILILAMILSICFLIVDILSVTKVIQGNGAPSGINPFWKLSFIFKCLTDTVILDDFKTALDRLKQYKMERLGNTVPEWPPKLGNASDSSTNSRTKKLDPPARGSIAKQPNWESDVERLDFCTVPNSVHLSEPTWPLRQS